jgi:hypothetical protein
VACVAELPEESFPFMESFHRGYAIDKTTPAPTPALRDTRLQLRRIRDRKVTAWIKMFTSADAGDLPLHPVPGPPLALVKIRLGVVVERRPRRG